MRKIREGRWLCRSCGRENPGRNLSCDDGCGRSRGNSRLYLPHNSPIIVDPDLTKMAEEQPNWNCDHCGGANPGVVNNHPVIACAHCGHPRDSADDTYEARTYAPGTVPRNDLEANPRQQPQQRRASKPPVRTSKQFHDSIFGPLLLTLIFAALIIITLASFIAPVTISDGVVSERSWERSIEVEELQSIRTSGWALPPGAELISEEMRVHKTIDVVVDHVPRHTHRNARNKNRGRDL